MKLYHWTCNHGRPGIEASGVVEPRFLRGLGTLAWFRSGPHPDPLRTGLLSRCSGVGTDRYRAAWRFVVLEPEKCQPWRSSDARKKSESWAPRQIERLGNPWNWYVATESARVVLG